jgi:sugar transferase (PEP-CTERM system associated)
MRQIRLFSRYINISYLFLAGLELAVLMAAAYTAVLVRFRGDPIALQVNMQGALPSFAGFAITLGLMAFAMRAYSARFKEGHLGMALRTLVAYFLLGGSVLLALQYLLPFMFMGEDVLGLALPIALAYVTLLRWLFFSAADDRKLAQRTLVLGAGQRAKVLLEKLGGVHLPGLEICGFISGAGGELRVPADLVLDPHGASLLELVRAKDVSEIVVALDEQRSTEGGHFPLDELLDCKLDGIQVTEILSFLERELEKVEIDLLRASWLVFSDGFKVSTRRDVAKRGFDLLAALTLLAVAWPFMLLTAMAIWAESRFRGPILYRQERTGRNGQGFMLVKYRSMRTDAEVEGRAVWAKANDDRVTRVGRFIRATRLDELPQLWNILKGDMSFVGPRPERPQFVEQLAAQIPYFNERHRVKPGLAGWAQLCFPYGASVEDAAEKLRYDLYYIKNHSILMDLLILVQTVEVVLVGKGVR